jgi:hypothetical protein
MRSLRSLALLAGLTLGDSYPTYIPMNPNGASFPTVAAIGHVNPAGGGE